MAGGIKSKGREVSRNSCPNEGGGGSEETLPCPRRVTRGVQRGPRRPDAATWAPTAAFAYMAPSGRGRKWPSPPASPSRRRQGSVSTALVSREDHCIWPEDRLSPRDRWRGFPRWGRGRGCPRSRDPQRRPPPPRSPRLALGPHLSGLSPGRSGPRWRWVGPPGPVPARTGQSDFREANGVRDPQEAPPSAGEGAGRSERAPPLPSGSSRSRLRLVAAEWVPEPPLLWEREAGGELWSTFPFFFWGGGSCVLFHNDCQSGNSAC